MKLITTTIVAALLVGCTTMLPSDLTLYDAAQKGDVEAVKQYLSAGADVNVGVRTGSGLWIGGTTTPLHAATYSNRKEITELLIAKGADVNVFESKGLAPLDVAIRRKYPETADLLRKHGGKKGKELKTLGNHLFDTLKELHKPPSRPIF